MGSLSLTAGFLHQTSDHGGVVPKILSAFRRVLEGGNRREADSPDSSEGDS